MKFLLTSDLHRDGAKLLWLLDHAPAHVALLVAGDLLEIFSKTELAEQSAATIRWRDEVLANGKSFAWCSGNHDFLEGDRTPMLDASPLWMKQTPSSETCISDGESGLLQVGIERIAITTIPWQIGQGSLIVNSKPIGFANFVMSLLREGKKLHAAEHVPWFVLWHEPPGGTPLSIPNAGPEADFGRRLIEATEPDFSLHGHIHHAPTAAAGTWICRLGRTVCFNPGQSLEGQPPQFVLLESRGEGDWTAQWHGDGRTAIAHSGDFENPLDPQHASVRR